MQLATFIVLLAGFVLAASAGSDNNLTEKVKTINTILQKYDQELYRVVPFKAIQTSISGLDVMSENYNGDCAKMIDKAGEIGHRAIDNYYRGTDKLFRWSASATKVLPLVLSRQETFSKDKLEKAIGATINKGFTAFNESLASLDTVVNQMEEMQGQLEPIPAKLDAELKKIQQQHEEDVKNKRESGEFIKKGLQALSKLVTFVLEYAQVPDAAKFDLDKELHLSGLPEKIIEGKMIPDANQKLKIVEAYYKVLTKTVLSATENVTQVKDEFKNSFVDQLRPWNPEGDSSRAYSNSKNKDSNESNSKDNSGEKVKCSGEKGKGSEEKAKDSGEKGKDSGEGDNTAALIQEVRNLIETLKQLTERSERSTKRSYKLQSRGSGENKERIIWPLELKSGQGENKERIIWPLELKSGQGDNIEDNSGSHEIEHGHGDNKQSKIVPNIAYMAAEVYQIMDETAKEREDAFWRITTTGRPSRRHAASGY